MDETQQRREDAWATLRDMHDQLNGPPEPQLTAANGWCAPSKVSYQVKNAAGQVVISYP